jgi:hypothetical protein
MPRRLLAIAALAVIGLSGCATPAPVSSPAASPASEAPSSPPSPEPDEVNPAELVVRGAGVELYGSDGQLISSFVWADETETALDVLELAFGPSPEPTLREGDGTHYADFAVYDFSGVTYFSAVNLEKPRTEYFLPSIVQIDTGEPINGVSIHTIDDLTVGGDLAEVLAASPQLEYPDPLGTAYLFDAVDPSKISALDDFTDMVAVMVDPDGTIMRIVAPYQSRALI